jgi:hypothetical protein
MRKVKTPYPSRERRKALRAAIKANTDFEHGGAQHDELLNYLEDIAIYLSELRPAEQAEVLAYVIRTMGEFVQEHAEDIYEPYGYVNPFAVAAPAPPPTPLWAYPVIQTPPPGKGPMSGGDWPDYSALRMFGYTVGKLKGWPKTKRQAFLTAFIEMSLPPVVEATFPGQYGAPLSTQRLKKVANVIAGNATNFYRNDPKIYAVAIADYADDLLFLKQKYYDGAGLKFQPWPVIGPSPIA